MVFNGEPSPKFQDHPAIVPIAGLVDVFVNCANVVKQVLLNVNEDTGGSNTFTGIVAVLVQPSIVVLTNVTL